ncbi:short-chain dehydrogenase, partial [Moniliophthora roreri MCA 2997]
MFSQMFPLKPKFWQKDIPDLSDKVMIITGVKTGLVERSNWNKLLKNFKKVTGRCAIFLELDLASFKSIKKAAEEFL